MKKELDLLLDIIKSPLFDNPEMMKIAHDISERLLKEAAGAVPPPAPPVTPVTKTNAEVLAQLSKATPEINRLFYYPVIMNILGQTKPVNKPNFIANIATDPNAANIVKLVSVMDRTGDIVISSLVPQRTLYYDSVPRYNKSFMPDWGKTEMANIQQQILKIYNFITTSPKTPRPTRTSIDSSKYDSLFDQGIEQGQRLDPEGDASNIKDILASTVIPIMNKLKEELRVHACGGKNKMTEAGLVDFVRLCYVVVTMISANSRDENAKYRYIQEMAAAFRGNEWKTFPSLNLITKEHGWGSGYLDPKKANELFKIIEPQIIQNINAAIENQLRTNPPKDQILIYSIQKMMGDIRSGHLTNIYKFCETYKNVLGGSIDSASMQTSKEHLELISRQETTKAANFILEKIKAYSYLCQHTTHPSWYQSPQDMPEPEEVHERTPDEPEPPAPPKKEPASVGPEASVWAEPSTIKICGAFLYNLYLAMYDKLD